MVGRQFSLREVFVLTAAAAVVSSVAPYLGILAFGAVLFFIVAGGIFGAAAGRLIPSGDLPFARFFFILCLLVLSVYLMVKFF